MEDVRVTRTTGAAALLCMLLTSAVCADAVSPTGTVKLKYLRVSPRKVVTIRYPGGQETGYAGRYNLQLDPTYDPDGGFPGTGEGEAVYAASESDDYKLETFCADLYDNPAASYQIYEVYLPEDLPVGPGQIPLGDKKAAELRKLFFNKEGLVGGSADLAAAFNACVWEIVYENSGPYDIEMGEGDLYVVYGGATPGWVNTANDWLSDLSGYKDPDIGVRVLVNAGLQDFAMSVSIVGASTDSIPEPLTMLGVFAGVAGVGTYIRRRRAGTR